MAAIEHRKLSGHLTCANGREFSGMIPGQLSIIPANPSPIHFLRLRVRLAPVNGWFKCKYHQISSIDEGYSSAMFDYQRVTINLVPPGTPRLPSGNLT